MPPFELISKQSSLKSLAEEVQGFWYTLGHKVMHQGHHLHTTYIRDDEDLMCKV